MTLQLFYTEIASYVKRRFLIQLQLSYVDERTVEIGYKPSKFLPAMSISVHVDACGNDRICLSYDCNAAMAAIISGGVGYLGDKIPEGIEVNPSDKRAVLSLDRMDILEKPLRYLKLEAICFHNDHVDVTASLR